MRIELRGVIVPSFYDTEWAQEYIDKGLMTPESAFRAKVASAPKDEPLDVYVNSPGGSVFAAYEMINAVRDWKAETGQKANVTIGAMAASAASAFAVMAGSSVRVHRNAKMMFHGATADAWGGKESMEDTAELLGKINADIQNVLIQKYNMDPETVAEWFAEGRQGWLSADEMNQAGIASEIIEDDADVILFDDAAVKAIDEQGLAIAALLEIKDEDAEEEEESEEEIAKQDEEEAETTEEESAEEKTDDGDESGDDSESGDAGEGEGEEQEEVGGDGDAAAELPEAQTIDSSAEPAEDYQRGYADGVTVGRNEIAAEYQERIDQYEARLNAALEESRRHQSERDKLADQLKQEKITGDARATALQEQLDAATDRLKKHVDGALSFEPEPMSWEQALEMCGNDYTKAKAKYGALLVEFKQREGKK